MAYPITAARNSIPGARVPQCWVVHFGVSL
jgi:hypothetical protein